MQSIVPFKDADEAVKALDNGGRFYNLLTKADDGIITAAEVGKIAGVYSNKQQMAIYLSMSVSHLDASSVNQIMSALSPDLQAAYNQYQPKLLSPSQAEAEGVIAQSAIITGIPRHIESKKDFNGFVMIPIFAGSVITFTLIPIIDKYDVYQIRDEASAAVFFIAHARGTNKLPEKNIKIGGIIKELKAGKEVGSSTHKYLEAFYYTSAQ